MRAGDLPEEAAAALYVSDLDGTLLGPDARLSAFSRTALSRVIAMGARFTIASARSIQSMRPILGDLPLRLPVVALNGALVSDLATGVHHRVAGIAPSQLRRVLEAAERRSLTPFVTTHDGERDNLYSPRPANEGMAWYAAERARVRDPRLREGYAQRGWLAETVVALNFIGPEEPLRALSGDLERCCRGLCPVFTEHLYTPGWFWLTVHSGEATKDRALAWLRDRFGLASLPVVAFGDQANDIPLLRWADHAVAVANADAEVKAEADEVIGPNFEDSVARFLLGRLGVAER